MRKAQDFFVDFVGGHGAREFGQQGRQIAVAQTDERDVFRALQVQLLHHAREQARRHEFGAGVVAVIEHQRQFDVHVGEWTQFGR